MIFYLGQILLTDFDLHSIGLSKRAQARLLTPD